MLLLVQMLVRMECKRTTQLTHDLAGVHISIQRAQRSNANGIVPYSIKSSEIAVQREHPVRPKGETGQKTEFGHVEFHLHFSPGHQRTRTAVVQDGPRTVEVTGLFCPVDHSLKQSASLVISACSISFAHCIIFPYTA